MIDPIAGAAGKLDDPLMLEWAVQYYDQLPANARDARARVESTWFHDVVLARLVEQEDLETLTSLFRLLPPEHFANLVPLMLKRWVDWPGRMASLALPILAKYVPGALLDLLENSLSRMEQGSKLDPARFSDLRVLRAAGPAERCLHFLDRLARYALGLPEADVGRNLLLSGLLQEADALGFETLERVLVGGLRVESRDYVQESMLNRLFRGLFGHSEYLDLVFACGRQQATQELRTLAPFFEPSAPLDQLDQWITTPPPLDAILPVLEAAGRIAPGGAVLHSLLISGSTLVSLLSGQRASQLAVAGCIHAYTLGDFNATGLDLPGTLNLLAADLDRPRWAQALCARLTQFPRAEVASRLMERLPTVSHSYGGVQIAQAMGTLAWDEFVSCLMDALDENQPDYLCVAAQTALMAIGAPARDALIADWDQLDMSQCIFGLSVISAIGGQAAADFAVIRFEELLAEQEESFCELALAVPDLRVLERLRPELRRKQSLIDRCYAILARLLDKDDEEAQAAQQRALAEYARSAQWRENLEYGGFSRDSLSLSLRCPICGGVNNYDVAGAILPGQWHRDLPYLIEDEFPCVSCGAWVEFEFTPKAMMALTAETILITAAKESRKDRRPLVRLLDCSIGGRVMPIAAGLKSLRERVDQNPKDSQAWYQLGVFYASIRRPRAAREAYEHAAVASPAVVDVALRQAELLVVGGHPENALQRLVEAWARQPDWQFFGDPKTVQQQFVDLHNRLRRELGRTDLPALHPASMSTPRKVGRNDPCPCGSGKKFKKCCGS